MSEEAKAEYVRLFEAAEQELKKAYNQLQKEQKEFMEKATEEAKAKGLLI